MVPPTYAGYPEAQRGPAPRRVWYDRGVTGTAWRGWVGVPPHPKGNDQRIVRVARRLKIKPSKKVEGWQRALTLALLVHPARPPEKLTGPLDLDVTFVLRIPPSWSAWKREAAACGFVHPYSEGKSAGSIADRGNLLKLVEDCLEKADWLCNDSQVIGGDVRKVYGPEPGYVLELTQLDEVRTLAEWRALQRHELSAKSGVLS